MKNMAKKFRCCLARRRTWRRNRRRPALSSSPRTGATSGAGIRRRGDPDRDFHCEMVGRGPKPRALQRYRLARLVHNCDSHEVFIPDHSTRRIEVDPAGAGNVDLDPSMGVSAGDFLVVVIAKMPDLKRNAASKNVERC